MNMHVNGAAAIGVPVAPYSLGQLVAGEDLVRTLRQCREQAIFGAGELEWRLVQPHMAVDPIDDEASHLNLLRLRSSMLNLPRPTAKHCIDAGLELVHIERLGDEIVGPKPQGEDGIALPLSGTAHNDGNVGLGAGSQLRAEHQAIHVWEQEIEDDQI